MIKPQTAIVRYLLMKYSRKILSQRELRKEWNKIKQSFNQCCYCGENRGILQKEHLLGLNTREFGFDVPWNIVPVCAPCNNSLKSTSSMNGRNVTRENWKQYLRRKCNGNTCIFQERAGKIKAHIKTCRSRYKSSTRADKHLRKLRKLIEQARSDVVMITNKYIKSITNLK